MTKNNSIPPFSLLLKPSSADCNLRCEYCFYINHQEKSPHKPRMTYSTLTQIMRNYFATNQPNYSFSWQGGEPTLMGLKFFQKVVDIQQNFGESGALITNTLQTNGTLIDDSWAQFLSKYNFLVGISLDGPPDLHNYYRRSKGGKPTHQRVLHGIHFLKKFQVPFNILSLVNNYTVSHAKEIFNYFLKNDFYYQQYIPCVEFEDKTYETLAPFAIDGNQWGTFLKELFKEWYPDHMYQVSIRLFDSILEYLIYGTYNSCQFSPHCGHYFVIEFNGDIYPCDFFVEPRFYLGNIHETNWDSIFANPVLHEFKHNKDQSIQQTKCVNCKYKNLCHGGCLKNHQYHKPSGKDILCEGYRMFFDFSLPTFQKISKNIRKEQNITFPVDLLNI